MNSKSMIQNWTTGELNALVKNLGGEKVAKKIQRGEVRVSFENITNVLFDKNGQRIPKDLSADIRNINWGFQLDQPKLKTEIDYAKRIQQLYEYLGLDAEVTGKQFKTETERLLALIQKDSQIANIIKGVYLPVILPQLINEDLGTVLEQYLKTVQKNYTKTFDGRGFLNNCNGTLVGKVNTVDQSRHNQLVERMKQGLVIGIHFPNALQGFSINADREQMSTLPNGLILSGLDTLIALMMYPDILACSWNVPGLDLAALSWQATDSFFFEADDDYLSFNSNNIDSLASAHDNYSGGLLFLG